MFCASSLREKKVVKLLVTVNIFKWFKICIALNSKITLRPCTINLINLFLGNTLPSKAINFKERVDKIIAFIFS